MPAVTPADVHTSPSRIQIGVGVDVDLGVAAGEAVGAGPVRRHPPAVEQAGGGQHERARCTR